jgi:hypothetical protein
MGLLAHQKVMKTPNGSPARERGDCEERPVAWDQ